MHPWLGLGLGCACLLGLGTDASGVVVQTAKLQTARTQTKDHDGRLPYSGSASCHSPYSGNDTVHQHFVAVPCGLRSPNTVGSPSYSLEHWPSSSFCQTDCLNQHIQWLLAPWLALGTPRHSASQIACHGWSCGGSNLLMHQAPAPLLLPFASPSSRTP